MSQQRKAMYSVQMEKNYDKEIIQQMLCWRALEEDECLNTDHVMITTDGEAQ